MTFILWEFYLKKVKKKSCKYLTCILNCSAQFHSHKPRCEQHPLELCNAMTLATVVFSCWDRVRRKHRLFRQNWGGGKEKINYMIKLLLYNLIPIVNLRINRRKQGMIIWPKLEHSLNWLRVNVRNKPNWPHTWVDGRGGRRWERAAFFHG